MHNGVWKFTFKEERKNKTAKSDLSAKSETKLKRNDILICRREATVIKEQKLTAGREKR